MTTSKFYRIKAPKVECQLIDGEAIFIDFDSGAYFSANKSGSAIIAAIQQGMQANEIAGQMSQAYGTDDRQMSEATNAFLEQLMSENLIEATDEPLPIDPDPEMTVCADTAFETPTLDKYTDLEQMLLLDPIHDVDRSGWPTQKQTGDAS